MERQAIWAAQQDSVSNKKKKKEAEGKEKRKRRGREGAGREEDERVENEGGKENGVEPPFSNMEGDGACTGRRHPRC